MERAKAEEATARTLYKEVGAELGLPSLPSSPDVRRTSPKARLPWRSFRIGEPQQAPKCGLAGGVFLEPLEKWV